MIARMLATGRFPRAAVVLEILALAELFRTTAGAMDKLAENAHAYEPSSLRRAAHGVVRGVVLEVAGQVTL